LKGNTMAEAKKTTAKASSAKTATKTVKSEATGEKRHALKLHHLKPAAGAVTKKTRVGRGEASKGKTAGRGTKGTKARYQVKVGFEGGQMPLHMRLPKLRGFKNPFRTEYQVVNLDRLSKLYPKGGKLNVEDLVLKGLVRTASLVKVLGEGEVTAKFDITADAFSKSAITKIEAAGGTVTLTTKEAQDKIYPKTAPKTPKREATEK
jgi:large subunit ribosomal protein L15